MRLFKIFGMAIGGLVALVVLGLVAIWLFFDPNDYKDRITAAVQRIHRTHAVVAGQAQALGVSVAGGGNGRGQPGQSAGFWR